MSKYQRVDKATQHSPIESRFEVQSCGTDDPKAHFLEEHSSETASLKTTSLKTNYGKLSKATFKAPTWAKNPHVQTIFPRYCVSHPQIKTANERIATPDNDFLDLAWSIPVEANKAKGLVVIFHGLEGSKDSHYVKHLVEALNQSGFISVLMHFRGCSHELNLTAKAYHSGATEDPLFALTHVSKRYPKLGLFTVGFSLGGNMLMNLVAEQDHDIRIKTAVSISAPLNLSACAKRMENGFSTVYQNHLIKSMQDNLLSKYKKLNDEQRQRMLTLTGLSQQNFTAKVRDLKTFYQFDDRITAPIHGFENAQSYYDSCSALPKLKHINIPTLLVHAQDDPFMTEEVIPKPHELSPSTAYELSEYGGHVGFMYGSIFKPKLWLAGRILAHFDSLI